MLNICLIPNQFNELLQRIRNFKSSQNMKLMKLNDCDGILTECSFILHRLTRLTYYSIHWMDGLLFCSIFLFHIPSIVPFCWQSRLNDIEKKKVNFRNQLLSCWWHNKIHRLFNTYYSNTMTQIIVQSQNVNGNVNINIERKKQKQKYSLCIW